MDRDGKGGVTTGRSNHISRNTSTQLKKNKKHNATTRPASNSAQRRGREIAWGHVGFAICCPCWSLPGILILSSSYIFSKGLDFQNDHMYHFLEIKTCRLPQLTLSATSTHLSFLGCSGFVALSSLLYK